MEHGASRKRKRKRKGGKSGLPNDLSALLGTAHMHYAAGDSDEAIPLLMEVIRNAPNFPDPYHTLGLIYKDRGDMDQALEYSKIAAYLTPKNPVLWKDVALMARELGHAGVAIDLYSRVLRYDSTDFAALEERATLYSETGEYIFKGTGQLW